MGIESASSDQTSVTVPGSVEKIIKPIHPSLPEKTQIAVEGADGLYREIRIENVLKDEDGQKVKWKSQLLQNPRQRLPSRPELRQAFYSSFVVLDSLFDSPRSWVFDPSLKPFENRGCFPAAGGLPQRGIDR